MWIAAERIADLASREGVQKIAVENFLGTLGGLSRAEARANLEQDTKAYSWGTATGRAIQQGIEEAKDE
jgi:hypothetical protein